MSKLGSLQDRWSTCVAIGTAPAAELHVCRFSNLKEVSWKHNPRISKGFCYSECAWMQDKQHQERLRIWNGLLWHFEVPQVFFDRVMSSAHLMARTLLFSIPALVGRAGFHCMTVHSCSFLWVLEVENVRWMRWSWPSTDLWVWHWISAPTGRLFDTAPVEIPCARQLMLAFVARGTFQWPVVYQYVRSLVLRDQPGRCYVHHHSAFRTTTLEGLRHGPSCMRWLGALT